MSLQNLLHPIGTSESKSKYVSDRLLCNFFQKISTYVLVCTTMYVERPQLNHLRISQDILNSNSQICVRLSKNSTNFVKSLDHRLFSSKSQTFVLGQTIWVDKFWDIWGICSKFISTNFGTVSLQLVVHVFQAIISTKS